MSRIRRIFAFMPRIWILLAMTPWLRFPLFVPQWRPDVIRFVTSLHLILGTFPSTPCFLFTAKVCEISQFRILWHFANCEVISSVYVRFIYLYRLYYYFKISHKSHKNKHKNLSRCIIWYLDNMLYLCIFSDCFTVFWGRYKSNVSAAISFRSLLWHCYRPSCMS